MLRWFRWCDLSINLILSLFVLQCALAFVSEEILQVTAFEKLSDFQFKGDAVFDSMSVVAMKVAPLWGIPFVAWSYHLARPSDHVAHVLEYRHEFCWRNTEIVLWHFPILLRAWWSIERTTSVSSLFTTSTGRWVRIYTPVCSSSLYSLTSLRLSPTYLDGYPTLASSSFHLIWAHALAKTSSIVLQGYLVSSL